MTTFTLGTAVWGLALAGALSATALAGMRMADALAVQRALISADPPETEAAATAAPKAIAPKPPRTWPALFGEPALAPVVEEAVAPVALDMVLKGLVTSGTMRWAVITVDGADMLVTEGDQIGDAIVVAIRQDGVEVELGGQSQLVVFDDSAPVRSVDVEVGLADDPEPEALILKSVRTQVASPIELRDIILRAEAERQAKRGAGD